MAALAAPGGAVAPVPWQSVHAPGVRPDAVVLIAGGGGGGTAVPQAPSVKKLSQKIAEEFWADRNRAAPPNE